MSGVEILSQRNIYDTFIPAEYGAFAFIAMIVLLIIFPYICDKKKIISVMICITLLFACTTIMTLGLLENKDSINHVEYKVIIDDSVSMDEFMDKYKILYQEGKIYTVKERN